MRLSLIAVSLVLCAMLAWGVARAQHPMLDMMANMVVQKYQSATCFQRQGWI